MEAEKGVDEVGGKRGENAPAGNLPVAQSFPVSPNRLNINNTDGLPVTCR